MKYMPLKMLDSETLAQLNTNSIKAGRMRNLSGSTLLNNRQSGYPINYHEIRHRKGTDEVRVSVVLNLAGQTAFLDITPEEFAAIPEVAVLFDVWEGVMCAGNPPLEP